MVNNLSEIVESYNKKCQASAALEKERLIDHKIRSIISLCNKVRSNYKQANNAHGFLGRMVNKIVDINYRLIISTLDDIEDELIRVVDKTEQV